MIEQLNPITSAYQTDGEEGVSAAFGAESDNVFLYDQDNNYLGTLTDLVQNWEDFKASTPFVYVGKVNPKYVEQIQHWYQTFED